MRVRLYPSELVSGEKHFTHVFQTKPYTYSLIYLDIFTKMWKVFCVPVQIYYAVLRASRCDEMMQNNTGDLVEGKPVLEFLFPGAFLSNTIWNRFLSKTELYLQEYNKL